MVKHYYKVIYFIIYLFFLFYSSCLYAQNINTGNIENCLVDNRISAILIDTHDNKWFATCEGVSKFDGKTWTTYKQTNGLVNNNVNCMAMDSKGNVWFGTQGGVSKFDGNKWTSYTTSKDGIGFFVYAISIDSLDNVWIGTHDGLSKFGGAQWVNYTVENEAIHKRAVLSIAIDSKSNKWLATDKGIVKFNDVSWEKIVSPIDTSKKVFLRILIDSKNNKWCITNKEDGVYMFNDSIWHNYKKPDGLVSNYVLSIAIDRLGNKWFGTCNGASMLNVTNWKTYTNDLINNCIRSIAIDSKNNIWFGTNMGAIKLENGSFTNYIDTKPKPIKVKHRKSFSEFVENVGKVEFVPAIRFSYSQENRQEKLNNTFDIGFCPIFGDEWIGVKPYLGFGVYNFANHNVYTWPKIGFSCHLLITCIDINYYKLTNFENKEHYLSTQIGLSIMGILEGSIGYTYRLSKENYFGIEKNIFPSFSITVNFPLDKDYVSN